MRKAATASACRDEGLVVMQLHNVGGRQRLRSLARDTAGNAPVTGGSFLAPVNENHTDRTIRWPDGDRA
jgi:hypothetical protein